MDLIESDTRAPGLPQPQGQNLLLAGAYAHARLVIAEQLSAQAIVKDSELMRSALTELLALAYLGGYNDALAMSRRIFGVGS